MSTKVLCDGCDEDITEKKSDTRHGVRVAVSSSDGDVVLGQFNVGPFDLCGYCISRFKNDCNPKAWPRIGGAP